MNKFKITILLFLFAQLAISQVFDDEIQKVITNVTTKLNNHKENLTIAIYPFRYNKDNEDVLAEYITDEFWDKMPNAASSFSVMDRSTFEEYFQEHKLNTDGLIDPKTEKQFGMLIAADAYITGKAYVFNSVINLKVRVTDTQTGQILMTGSNKLPITYDIAEYIGLDGWQKIKEESKKNKSLNPNCAEEKVGDICFQNTYTKPYHITVQDLGMFTTMYRKITVYPGEHGCFKDLPVQGFFYSASINPIAPKRGENNKSGNFYINKCQSSVIKI